MHDLLERDQADLRAPFKMLGTVLADKPGQGVQATEALVACGRRAVPILFW